MTPKEAIYLADYCLDNTQVREALKAMARQVEELQEDAERYSLVRAVAECDQDSIWIKIQKRSIDISCAFALDETLDMERQQK